jgi:hypothetical protein
MALGGCEMEHKSADAVGVRVEEMIEIGLGQAFGCADDAIGFAHPRQH